MVARWKNVFDAMLIAVGGVRRAKVVVGPKSPQGPIEPNYREFDDARETVGVGTLFWDDQGPQMHLHMAFGRGDEALVGCPRGGAEASASWRSSCRAVGDQRQTAARRPDGAEAPELPSRASDSPP